MTSPIFNVEVVNKLAEHYAEFESLMIPALHETLLHQRSDTKTSIGWNQFVVTSRANRQVLTAMLPVSNGSNHR